jgi:hypothetical protein
MPFDTNATLAQSLGEAVRVIIGETLGPVTFAADYWHLDFSGHQFTVMTRLTVKARHWQVGAGEEFFRDRLCERIGKRVTETDVTPEAVTLFFEDGIALEIALPPPGAKRQTGLVFWSYRLDSALIV